MRRNKQVFFAADVYHGGLPGMVGEVVLSDGKHPHPKSRYVIHPRQIVTLRLPGGGGFYSPLERDPGRVLEDVKQGYVSLKALRRNMAW